ncbi:MAG TPA: uroporphyrinogen decarboxylase [Acetobacteraceae bacterium]|nr:uroporphyrinogen decarboxylase [Acetobacteraceae bacterium]
MDSSAKPLLRALAGNPVWPPPIWLMRQAGRYLPEYRAVRSRAGDFISLCMTPELAAEVTLQPIRRYRFDGAILFSDILLIPWALGQGLDYREGEGPVLPPLRSAGDVRSLRPARLASAIAPILEAVRRVRHVLAHEGFAECSLIGFAGAPFTVACYMVEGSGSRDFAATRTMAYADPELFGNLIGLLTESTVTYLSAQIEAGAEAVMLFDTWAGILPPALFRRYVIEPARTIVESLRQRHPSVPVIGFPRLAGMLIDDYVRVTGIDGVGLDSSMDLRLAGRVIPQRTAIQGNLDPFALVAGGPGLRDETASILSAMRTRPFVFNLGHGIVPQTPPEHVARLVEQVRAA